MLNVVKPTQYSVRWFCQFCEIPFLLQSSVTSQKKSSSTLMALKYVKDLPLKWFLRYTSGIPKDPHFRNSTETQIIMLAMRSMKFQSDVCTKNVIVVFLCFKTRLELLILAPLP